MSGDGQEQDPKRRITLIPDPALPPDAVPEPFPAAESLEEGMSDAATTSGAADAPEEPSTEEPAALFEAAKRALERARAARGEGSGPARAPSIAGDRSDDPLAAARRAIEEASRLRGVDPELPAPRSNDPLAAARAALERARAARATRKSHAQRLAEAELARLKRRLDELRASADDEDDRSA